MSKETLQFIETLYDREKSLNPALDHDSFVAGAMSIVEHLIDRL